MPDYLVTVEVRVLVKRCETEKNAKVAAAQFVAVATTMLEVKRGPIEVRGQKVVSCVQDD